jgi:hypothetical protein
LKIFKPEKMKTETQPQKEQLQQTAGSQPILVTADNFNRAETDLYFSSIVKRIGLAKFDHNRETTPIDKQTVIRMNRDTLYSAAVFDLDAGPATIILPDAGSRFMSMQIINQDQYSPAVYYKPGSYTLKRDEIGTRYVAIAIRTLVDPSDPKDIEKVHALQDALKIIQENPGKFEIPAWDMTSQKKVREALLILGSTLPDSKNMFGAKDKVDPVRFLIGSAIGWGGNPEKEATYLIVTPAKNDSNTVHTLTVKDVPVDGFWSISVYNKQGYFEKNDQGVYSVNNLTANKNEDGSVTVQFGGCDGKALNCIPVTEGWNYTVRLYRPRPEILDGKWKFPEAKP